MQLNKFKKGFSCIRPERGLKGLVGTQKIELRDKAAETIRVSGTYIPGHKGSIKAGRFFGMLSYITSWLVGGLMLLSSLLPELNLPHPLSSFIFGCVLVHICMMLADGLQNSNSPWARKSVIIFWSAALLTFLLCLIS